MATLRELVVRFSLKADTKAIKDFEEKLSGAADAARDLVGFGAKIAGAYAASGGILVGLANSAADFAEETLRTSSAFGITAEKAQELSFAFQALGASQDDMADMFGTLTDRATDALEGSKNYRKEFERIGVSMDDLKGKNPGELFDLYIQGVSNAKNNNDALTASVRLLGDDLGRRVARGVRLAGSSFTDYIQILRESNGVFSDEMLENAQRGQMQFRLLGATFQMLRRRIGLELAPVFGDFAARIVSWFARNSEAVDEFVKRLRDGVQRELGRLVLYAKAADRIVKSTFGGWTNLAEHLAIALGAIVTGVGGAKLLNFFTAFREAFVLLTIPAVKAFAVFAAGAAILGAMTLVLEDLFVATQGGDSLIGKFIERFKQGGPILRFVAWVLQLAVDNFKALQEEAGKLVADLSPVIPLLKFLGGALASWAAGFILAMVSWGVLLARFVIFAIQSFISLFRWLVGAFEWFIATLSDSLARFPDAFMNMIGEIISAATSLFGWFDDELAAVFGEKWTVRGMVDRMATPEQQSGPLFPANVTRGADGEWRRGAGAAAGGGSTTQTNEWNVNVQAGSEAEGREAARGFKKEMESGGFFESLAERLNYGEI